MSDVLHVAVTGSECTGKTTLARELAERFSTSWSPEYAREYAETHPRPLVFADVEPIARGQIAAEDEAARHASRPPRGRRRGQVVVHDTDLLSTVVYSRHYYGTCPEWVDRAARERKAGLYLLLRPDVPWVADPARDRGERREEMHALFASALEEIGAPFVEIGGSFEQRRAHALAAIHGVVRPLR
jgi:NadR type nicotinamide-nucleotide adenylyltransferase